MCKSVVNLCEIRGMKYRKPYRVRRRKSVFKNRFFWLGILTLVLIGIVLYFALFASFFQIQEIQISGNQKVKKEDLENFVWEKVNRKIVLFQTKTIFLVNFQEIERNLLEKFPKISTVHLKREFPDILILNIQEREPLFIFCKNSDSCFYLDKQGVIFDPVRNGISYGVEKISEVEGLLLKIRDFRSQEINLGKKVIEDDLLKGVRGIVLKLRENLEISVKELTLFEEKIEVQTVQDFEIYFNPKGDISNQIQSLTSVLKKEIPLENRGNLEYIDLRFGNRVYYKYKQEE